MSVIQALLGRKNFTTTVHYCEVTFKKASEQVKKVEEVSVTGFSQYAFYAINAS